MQTREGKVQVEMTVQGENDPMCCPTLQVQKSCELEYGLLPVDER